MCSMLGDRGGAAEDVLAGATARVADGNLLGQRIEETLRPIIGVVLASVSLDIECKKLGCTPASLDRADLPRLADSLAVSLKLVVGADLARAAASKVREIA